MPTTPEQVVAALSDVLAIKARVELQDVSGIPHAVVAGPSGAETWIDLGPGMASLPGEDAASVASAIIGREGWDAVNLGRLLSELAKLGFCDISYEIDEVMDRDPSTVDGFTDAVIRAEGLDPATSDFRGKIRDIVARNLGRGPA